MSGGREEGEAVGGKTIKVSTLTPMIDSRTGYKRLAPMAMGGQNPMARMQAYLDNIIPVYLWAMDLLRIDHM